VARLRKYLDSYHDWWFDLDVMFWYYVFVYHCECYYDCVCSVYVEPASNHPLAFVFLSVFVYTLSVHTSLFVVYTMFYHILNPPTASTIPLHTPHVSQCLRIYRAVIPVTPSVHIAVHIFAWMLKGGGRRVRQYVSRSYIFLRVLFG